PHVWLSASVNWRTRFLLRLEVLWQKKSPLRRKTAGTAVISLSYGALIVPVMNTDRLLGRPLPRRQIMPRLNRLITSISLMAGSLLAPVTLIADVDSVLQDYVRAAGVSGNLSSIGSDTLNNLMMLWEEG